ncbi:hypothetical protein QUA82_32615 [Microcoleus sp. F8-D3]
MVVHLDGNGSSFPIVLLDSEKNSVKSENPHHQIRQWSATPNGDRTSINSSDSCLLV